MADKQLVTECKCRQQKDDERVKLARNQSKYRDAWITFVGELRPRTAGTYCHVEDIQQCSCLLKEGLGTRPVVVFLDSDLVCLGHI